MTNEYQIDTQRCKGCGLCITICPKSVLEISAQVNKRGYFPVSRVHPERCVYCALCCTICPDVALTIQEVGRAQTTKKGKPVYVQSTDEGQ